MFQPAVDPGGVGRTMIPSRCNDFTAARNFALEYGGQGSLLSVAEALVGRGMNSTESKLMTNFFRSAGGDRAVVEGDTFSAWVRPVLLFGSVSAVHGVLWFARSHSAVRPLPAHVALFRPCRVLAPNLAPLVAMAAQTRDVATCGLG